MEVCQGIRGLGEIIESLKGKAEQALKVLFSPTSLLCKHGDRNPLQSPGHTDREGKSQAQNLEEYNTMLSNNTNPVQYSLAFYCFVNVSLQRLFEMHTKFCQISRPRKINSFSQNHMTNGRSGKWPNYSAKHFLSLGKPRSTLDLKAGPVLNIYTPLLSLGAQGLGDVLQVHPHVQLIITSWTLIPHLAGYNFTNLTTNISICMKSEKHIFPLDISFWEILSKLVFKQLEREKGEKKYYNPNWFSQWTEHWPAD